jgi:glucoamylase
MCELGNAERGQATLPNPQPMGKGRYEYSDLNPSAHQEQMYRLVTLFLTGIIACQPLLAQQVRSVASGGPGSDAHWPSAAKDGFGTSNSLHSKVWFTLTNGVLSEVFYPTLDSPNTQSLQFIICRSGHCLNEGEGMTHRLRLLDPRALSFQQINTAKNGKPFSITKTYTTDPDRSSVLIDVSLSDPENAVSALYLYYDPSLRNSGMHDTGWNTPGAFLASDENVASALVSSTGFEQMSSDFAGALDKLDQLDRGDSWKRYDRAESGNVIQIAKLKTARQFTLALAFASNPAEALANARASLRKDFAKSQLEYETGWHAYLSSLRHGTTPHPDQINMAAMVLKALEDKTYRGAIIASPSTPWGGGPNANEATVSGYHAVWSRDLYQVATALSAVGDSATANRALDYLFKVQQRRDGSFPQNTWVDGRPVNGGSQLDEVALPIVLAFQLGRTDLKTWLRHIKPAADFILLNGPVTGQDRWEEKSGYSPATMAAEIAGLVCAADVALAHRDKSSATSYLHTADSWADKVDDWTATSNGPHGDGNYYLRLTETGNPNRALKIEINSGGGSYDQREIVDPGFLELVRLGIKSADDPQIQKSVAVIDNVLKVDTPVGSAWYRYNHDAYGERPDGRSYDGRAGVGRLWTLLTGERGEYELASGMKGLARARLDTMSAFANEGLMIPEQVWDRNATDGLRFRFGSGTGSATPLAWSMAQFIRLAVNINRGRNIETPRIVVARYLNNRKRNNNRTNLTP